MKKSLGEWLDSECLMDANYTDKVHVKSWTFHSAHMQHCISYRKLSHRDKDWTDRRPSFLHNVCFVETQLTDVSSGFIG